MSGSSQNVSHLSVDMSKVLAFFWCRVCSICFVYQTLPKQICIHSVALIHYIPYWVDINWKYQKVTFWLDFVRLWQFCYYVENSKKVLTSTTPGRSLVTSEAHYIFLIHHKFVNISNSLPHWKKGNNLLSQNRFNILFDFE